MHPRMLRLHHSTTEKLLRLRKEADSDGAYRVARRIHAVVLNSDGLTSGEIADTLRAPRSRVSEWLRNYELHGYEALLEGCRSGRPAELADEDLTALSDIIDSGPVAYGYLSGVWASPMIARVIEEEFGVSYHPGHVRKILYALGFSVQRPKRVLARADAEKQRKWHRRTYPAIKKGLSKKAPRSSTRTKRASGRTRPSTRRGRAGGASRKSR